MSEGLVEWLRAQLLIDEQKARAVEGHSVFDGTGIVTGYPRTAAVIPLHAATHIANWDPARVLREVEALRAIINEHEPQWQTVEWDHDQNGKGEALCCPRCQNAEHSAWHPPVGQAFGLPEGFVTPYVLAPCPTFRFVAAIFSDRPGYQESWRP